jgi:hypothetical protein
MSLWARRESSRITGAECFGCRIWIIANWPCSTASARPPRAESTSTPSINLAPGIAPSHAFNRIVVVRYRIYLESRGLAANTIRYSQLDLVFGRLLREMWIGEQDPRGLGEDKLEAVRSYAKFFVGMDPA